MDIEDEQNSITFIETYFIKYTDKNFEEIYNKFEDVIVRNQYSAIPIKKYEVSDSSDPLIKPGDIIYIENLSSCAIHHHVIYYYVGNKTKVVSYFSKNYSYEVNHSDVEDKEFNIKVLDSKLDIISDAKELKNMKIYHSEFCPICKETISDLKSILPNCGHEFCSECIFKHMKSSRNSSEFCPVCRVKILENS